MSSLVAPTLPIAKATVSKDGGGSKSATGGQAASAGQSSRKAASAKKQTKAWADYTPTYTPTPWGDGFPPYAFGPHGLPPFMSPPPEVEGSMLFPATPTPSAGGHMAFRPDLMPPQMGHGLPMQPPPKFAAMAAAAAAAAASAAAAAANACEVNAAATGDVDQWKGLDGDEPDDDQVYDNPDDDGVGLTLLSLADMPEGRASRGSTLHGTGKCRPCAWFWKPKKCQNETECVYCHLCPEGELKSRKKAKVQAMRAGALMPAAPLQSDAYPATRALKLSSVV
jgi:hypothetical protein